MALSQGLLQKLLQKLSPQQIQLMKLLQVPTAYLEDRIKEEMEENPALEMEEHEHEEGMEPEMIDEFDSSGEEDFDKDGSEDEYENLDLSEYVADEDGEIADYKMRDENYPELDDAKVIPIKSEISFYELLVQQLGLLHLDVRQYKIAEQIIGSLDVDGYLRREISSVVDDLAFRQNIDINEKKVEALIKKNQQFDPPGVAARNLQECLLLQLERKKLEGHSVELAIEILQKYFDEFTKKHYEKINNAGSLELSLSNKNAPDLRISDTYREMMREYERGSKKDKRQKEAV
jgi:RNA polymerase sigma-54 factor